MHDHAEVIKLGGSLLDLPDLPTRLAAFRAQHVNAGALLVVGGGEMAEAVRRFDRAHGLDETAGHWLAVRAMALNARMLMHVLDDAQLVGEASECETVWHARRLAVMEPVGWLAAAERAGEAVPHKWQFTSDSIAAHAAQRLGAARLTLLKSTLPKQMAGGQATLAQASAEGVVDEQLPRVVAAGRTLDVRLVNLRDTATPRCALRAAFSAP